MGGLRLDRIVDWERVELVWREGVGKKDLAIRFGISTSRIDQHFMAKYGTSSFKKLEDKEK